MVSNMRIAVNKSWGGFGLSREAQALYMEKKYGVDNIHYYEINGWSGKKSTKEDFIKRGGYPPYISITITDCGEEFDDYRKINIDWFEDCNDSIEFRSDPVLIKVLEELDDAANDHFAKIEIVDIPDDANVYIDYYDGMETVREKHRSW